MKILPLLIALGAPTGLSAQETFGPTSRTETGVAIVCAMTGESHVLARERQPLRLFDWLAVGSRIEVGPDSSLSLAFWNGRRFDLGAGARARIGRARLEAAQGPVRPLRAIPGLPIVAAIRDGDGAGHRSGAVRIRNTGALHGLYPRAGCATLADETVLRFGSSPGSRDYHVQIEDGDGRIVFERQVAASPLSVPKGLLQGGKRYWWRVRGRVDFGPAPSGEEEFVTLSAQLAQRRALLRQTLTPETGSSALLAGLDLELGLWMEAREELGVALAGSPGDAGLRRTLDELERRIADDEGINESSEMP